MEQYLLLGPFVKFASSLTEITEIRPYHMETEHGLHFIMMQYDRERRGYKHIVANKLQRGMSEVTGLKVSSVSVCVWNRGY